MSQHITDHKRERSDGHRAASYAKIEHGDQPSKATEALQRRAAEARSDAGRLTEYTRVDRGDAA